MKKQLLILTMVAAGLSLTSCGGSAPETQSQTQSSSEATEAPNDNDDKGIGPITSVSLSTPIDQKMADAGKAIYDLKCMACHHLDNTKLVGPGWKDVTKRRKPEWIMNFAINPDEMLNKDPKAMTLLEECLVRMPNQNLVESDARSVLEFMRKNDGEK